MSKSNIREVGLFTARQYTSKPSISFQERGTMENRGFTMDESPDFSDRDDWSNHSDTKQLDRTKNAESGHIPGEIKHFIEQLQNDDDDLFQQSLHIPDDEPPAHARPSVDDLDSHVNELPTSSGHTTMGTDSTTSRFDVSSMTSASPQSDEGNSGAPEGGKRIQAIFTSGTESGLPHKVNENGKLGEDEDEVYTAGAQENLHNMIGHDPQSLRPAYRNYTQGRSLYLRRSDSEVDSFNDDTTSVQSYADSIFDTGSVENSTSSVHSDTQALVGEYVDFLVCDSGLEKLFLRSMSPTVLGPERFRRNYRRILQSYSRDLKRQQITRSDARTQLYAQGLAFISRKSITMKTASLIASRYMEKAPQIRIGNDGPESSDQHSELDTSSGDEYPAVEPDHTSMSSELKLYFRKGAPFQRMKRNLRDLVIPSTLLSRVKLSTERVLDLLLGDEHLKSLLFKALSDPLAPLRDSQFDPEREILYFGSRLKVEANSPDHLRVAEFIETYAGYIGTRAVQRMERMDMEAFLQQPQVCTTLWEHLKC